MQFLSSLGDKWIGALPSSGQDQEVRSNKKRILVLYGPGGGGHQAAADAVRKAFSPDKYEVEIAAPFEGMAGDDWFNSLQRQGQHELLGMLTKMQPISECTFCPLQVKPKIEKKIAELKPHLIISVYPIANYMTLDIAREKKIPMMVIPTDIQANHFFNFIKNPGPSFKVGIPFNDPILIEALKDVLLPENFFVTGYPIRKEFSYSKEQLAEKTAEIEKEFQIAPGDKVIGIMMGSQGVGKDVPLKVQEICSKLNLPFKVHVVAFCVGNQELIHDTEVVKAKNTNPNVAVHVLKNKVDGLYVSALMGRSKTFVTKPGGGTLNELLAKKVYALYYVGGIKGVPWEGGNIRYVGEKKWGEALDEAHFIEQLTRVLQMPDESPIPDAPALQFEMRVRAAAERMLSAPVAYNDPVSSITDGLNWAQTHLFTSGTPAAK